MALVVIAAFAGIIAVIFRVAARRIESTRASWRSAARVLGLETTPGKLWSPPTLDGRLGLFSVKVDTFTQRSGNSSSSYTRYRVAYPDLGLGLALKPQGAFSRITRFFGAQDVEVGDDSFDTALVVKADDPDRVRSFLTPARRTAILRLFAVHGRATVDDDGVAVVTSGVESSEQRIVSTTRRAIAAASRLHDVNATDPALSRALERRLQGDAGEASREISAVVHAHPDDIDGRLLEIETLAAAGRIDDAAVRAEALSEELPDDPEVEGWRRYVDEDASPAPPTGPVAAAPPEPVIFDDLFGANRLSFEAAKVFDERYRGRRVTWRGRVRDARRFTKDRDFRNGPGTKAVITVATVDHDLYGQTAIDAIVRLPDGTPPLHRGDEVEFTGALDRVDPLMRNVYVIDGAIVTK